MARSARAARCFVCTDCGEQVLYDEQSELHSGPIACQQCRSTLCVDCAHHAMRFLARGTTARTGTTEQQRSTATRLRRVAGHQRRIELIVSECPACTRDPHLAEPDYAGILYALLTRHGRAFLDANPTADVQQVHEWYMRSTDVAAALSESLDAPSAGTLAPATSTNTSPSQSPPDGRRLSGAPLPPAKRHSPELEYPL